MMWAGSKTWLLVAGHQDVQAQDPFGVCMTWSWEWEENGAGLRASTPALGLALLMSGWTCPGDTRVMGRQGAAVAG